MSKILKFIIPPLVIFALLLAFQKAAHSYIEQKVNQYLKPYALTATLHQFDRVELESRLISTPPLVCKIKLEKGYLTLIPLNKTLIAKILPNKITMPIF